MYLRIVRSKDFSGLTNMNKLIKSWLVPIVVSIALFVVIRPVLAQTINAAPTAVGTEAIDGYTQVYYESGGDRRFITSDNINSRMPIFAGEYIAYVTDINGAGQIFLYDVVSSTKIQLTFVGTNLNPKVDDKGRVVWEGWDGGTWQIFLFDGKSIKQLTSGDTSINPDISDDYISYGRRDISGTWRAVVYSLKDDKSVDVVVGENARNPKIRNGEIFLAAGSLIEEKFPLSVADLFLLNLTPLTATASANLEATTSAIMDELNATASPVVEIPLASPSPSPAPQSTSSGQLEATPTPGT